MKVASWHPEYKKFLKSIEGKYIKIQKGKRPFLYNFYEAYTDDGIFVAGSSNKTSLKQILKEIQKNIQKLKNEGI